jgi:serine/threonine protein kinase
MWLPNIPLTTLKSFARKLVRCFVTKAEVKNEARIVSSLLKDGGHPNVISILKHGWLKYNYFFIDMELCDCTLFEYIKYSDNPAMGCPIAISKLRHMYPVFVHRNSPHATRLRNMWTVGLHIASGLEFMHASKYVHRDLKPRNGTTSPPSSFQKLIPVLYSLRENLWKLTDFGLSVEATSKKAHTTSRAGGTSSYRAPELLQEARPTYTNKVDIWALGCVFYELATGKCAFREDWDALEYAEDNSALPIPFPFQSEFWREHVSETLGEILHRDPTQRPRASALCLLFSSYCQILDYSADQELNSMQILTYMDWKELIRRPPTSLLDGLVEVCRQKGSENVAVILKNKLSRCRLSKLPSFWEMRSRRSAESTSLASLNTVKALWAELQEVKGTGKSAAAVKFRPAYATPPAWPTPTDDERGYLEILS